jgi:penicillin-insensitive murein endopeptidase
LTRPPVRPTTNVGIRLEVTMRWLAAAIMGAGLAVAAGNGHADTPAKVFFGAVARPSAGPPAAIGGHARGCLAGAAELATDGPGYQAMRLARERRFAHPDLVAFVERLAAELAGAGHPGLLVGDLAQPRGGPMASGHRSHQSGLDADIWYLPAPRGRLSRETRETMSAVPLVTPGALRLEAERFSAFRTAEVLRTAAEDPTVARIFVHPVVKRALCRRIDGERDWLGKIRPWWGHDHHFHVRLACPAGDAACVDQAPPPRGDGCDETLAWWFTEEPWAPADAEPPAPLSLAELPARCAALVRAD